jgi:anaerobic glycerol-3-phosphate dehydrogenase
LTWDEVKSAVIDFTRVMEQAKMPWSADFERGILVWNVWGQPKWAVAAQQSIALGDMRAKKYKRIVLVTLRDSAIVNAAAWMANVKHLHPRLEVSPLAIDVRALGARGDQSYALAHRLDQEAFQEKLVTAIGERVPAGVDAIALPPVMGVDGSLTFLQRLQSRTRCPSFELSAVHDSVPGYRLSRAINRALESHQISFYDGEVTHIERDSGAFEVNFRDRGGKAQRLNVDRVVLATGKFIGGGVRMGEKGPVEPLLRSAVYRFPSATDLELHPRKLSDGFPQALRLFQHGFFDRQPAMSVGLNGERSLEIDEGVYACGAALGGVDASRVGGLITAMVTGWRVGEMI